jgi:hypothetical protein
MEAVKKEITIPLNHHLILDIEIPASIPAGKTQVLLIFPDSATEDTDNPAVHHESRKQRLKELFAAPTGRLPEDYSFNRDELHER